MSQPAVRSTALLSPADAAKSTWTIDPSHTLVEFSVRHMMVSTVKGRFPAVSGTLHIDDTDPTNSSVSVEIETKSITTHDEQRDAHLRSADFFEADAYPTITFKSTSVEPTGEDTFKITGDLSIKDVTRPIQLQAELNGRGTNPWGKEVIGFSAQTSLNRKDFGLNWNVALEAGGVLVSDTIKITLEVEATR